MEVWGELGGNSGKRDQLMLMIRPCSPGLCLVLGLGVLLPPDLCLFSIASIHSFFLYFVWVRACNQRTLTDTKPYKIIGQDFPAVQWLRFCASTAGGMGSIPGRERSLVFRGAAKK